MADHPGCLVENVWEQVEVEARRLDRRLLQWSRWDMIMVMTIVKGKSSGFSVGLKIKRLTDR